MKQRNGIARRGALAGFLGATAFVLWFLVVDILTAVPLATPRFLAGALFSTPPAEVGIGLLAVFTALVYLVFLVIGIFMGWVLQRSGAGAHFLLGIVLGFLLFDIMFYSGVIVTGPGVVEQVGWPAVLGGCLLAGIIVLGTLHRTGPVPRRSWRGVLRQHEVVREGLVGGLLAAGAVALWFLVFDLLFRRAFFTPAALGSALFYGATSTAQVEISVGTVLGYTVVHVIVFVAIALVASAFANGAERQPALLLVFIMFFAAFEAMFIGLLALFAAWILDTLGWWNVALGNLIAAAVLVIYLWREHPTLAGMLRGESLERPDVLS